jgi:hypothetical protein
MRSRDATMPPPLNHRIFLALACNLAGFVPTVPLGSAIAYFFDLLPLIFRAVGAYVSSTMTGSASRQYASNAKLSYQR